MTRALFATIAVLFLLTVAAFPNEGQSGNKYAIIIAVSQYDNEQFSLPLTANDASALANTLHQRGGFEIIPLYECEGVSSPKTVPTKANIMSETQRVLENCKQGDTVLLYFSGHGYPDRQDPNKTYLLPKDVDVKKIPDTLLETAWLRNLLSNCKATTKFLMIDACHAGGEKSASLDPDSDLQQSKSLSSHELIGGDMAGVVTLASSTKKQLSYFWEEKGMSLFSYWLNEGLKGHADLNGDGEITFNELDDYVNKNVSKTAREVKNVTQTPVRIIGSDVEGVPVVITPSAVSLNVLLDDLAEQIAAAMRVHNIKRTSILEFSMEQGALNRTTNGTLPVYCAEQLEELIKYRLPRRDDFKIVARESVEKALASKGIGPDALFDNAISEANITFNGLPLESYVVGTIERQRSGEIRFRCILVSVDNIEKLHTSRGTAMLTESELGMLGHSFAIPEKTKIPAEVVNATPVKVISENITINNPESFLPQPPDKEKEIVRVAYKPVSAPMVNWLNDNYSQMPHPLCVSNPLLNVDVNVQRRIGNGYQYRPLVYKNNEAFVPLRMGDVYQIRLHNAQNEFIAARILVDGLNTLPQDPSPKNTLPQHKFAAIEEIYEVGPPPPVVESEPVIAPRVNLDSARYWLLPPNFRGVIPGFFGTAGASANYREFKVTTAPRSEAAQQGFTEQIGVITVAYYSTRKIVTPPNETEGQKRGRIAALNSKGALGTELGRERTTSLQTRDDLEIDQLLGIIQIYYSDEALAGDSVSPTTSTPSTTTESRQTVPVPQRQQPTRRGFLR